MKSGWGKVKERTTAVLRSKRTDQALQQLLHVTQPAQAFALQALQVSQKAQTGHGSRADLLSQGWPEVVAVGLQQFQRAPAAATNACDVIAALCCEEQGTVSQSRRRARCSRRPVRMGRSPQGGPCGARELPASPVPSVGGNPCPLIPSCSTAAAPS